MAVRCNMHMVTRVIEVTEFKYEVRFDLRGRMLGLHPLLNLQRKGGGENIRIVHG